MPDVRTPLISGNWKMNLDHFEALRNLQKLAWLLPKDIYQRSDVSIHPPFTDIRTLQTSIEADRMDVLLGAQHCHHEVNGAFTGEVSPLFLQKLDVKLVICGHSERRDIFGETDEMVNAKVKAILKHNMTPIMCVGESLVEREAGETEAKVLGQVVNGLQGVKKAEVGSMVIAYEPIWAIGTGRTATADDAQQVCASIRAAVTASFGADAGASVRIQYGGSVKPGTTEELMVQPDIDGALVGGASLDPEDFAQIVKIAAG
ncbi:MAG: triose-phosphate isomerase [Actinomycetota bacterium]|nr:triose-phosphate isomerase [Actinomycetota bacterium]MEC7580054.1 triose-phosphate isomerase [Actinomycetota bacterium]MEC8018762.1 triose-phosphate isomerase [Actinomycetota bacterium]MEC8522329.1 triose-phosphate isomerase [Actinomycetota bacterium]MEC9180991.1 triose-phosphate isomerase [Actinomycetota bacterium]